MAVAKPMLTEFGINHRLESCGYYSIPLIIYSEFTRYRVPTLLEDYSNAGLVVYHFAIEDGKV